MKTDLKSHKNAISKLQQVEHFFIYRSFFNASKFSDLIWHSPQGLFSLNTIPNFFWDIFNLNSFMMFFQASFIFGSLQALFTGIDPFNFPIMNSHILFGSLPNHIWNSPQDYFCSISVIPSNLLGILRSLITIIEIFISQFLRFLILEIPSSQIFTEVSSSLRSSNASFSKWRK